MYSLVIDASTERAVAALASHGKVIQKKELPHGNHGSRHLMPAIVEIFEVSGLTPQELDYIVVGVGPGSYTGMRVAAAIGKSLSFSLQRPLVGVSTLMGLIPENRQGPFAAILDARFAGVYLMKGVCDVEGISWSMVPTVVGLKEVGEALKEVSLLITTDKKRLSERLTKVYEWEEKAPDAGELAHQGHKKFVAGDFSDDLEILYLRPTQAEVEKKNLGFSFD